MSNVTVIGIFDDLRYKLRQRTSLTDKEFISILNSVGLEAEGVNNLGSGWLNVKSNEPTVSVKLGGYTLYLRIRVLQKPFDSLFYGQTPLKVGDIISLSFGTGISSSPDRAYPHLGDEYLASNKRDEGFCYKHNTNKNFDHLMTYHIFDVVHLSGFTRLADSIQDAFVRRAFLENTLLKKVLYKLYYENRLDEEKVGGLKNALTSAYGGIYSVPIRASYIIENYTTDDWNNSIDVGCHVIHEDASGIWCIITPDATPSEFVPSWYKQIKGKWVSYGLRLISRDRWNSLRSSKSKAKIKQNPRGFYPAVDPYSYLRVIDSGLVGRTLEDTFSVPVPDWVYALESSLTGRLGNLSPFGESAYRSFSTSAKGIDCDSLIDDIASYLFSYDYGERELFWTSYFPEHAFRFDVSIGASGSVTVKVTNKNPNFESRVEEIPLNVPELLKSQNTVKSDFNTIMTYLIKSLLVAENVHKVSDVAYTVSFTVCNGSSSLYDFSLVGA